MKIRFILPLCALLLCTALAGCTLGGAPSAPAQESSAAGSSPGEATPPPTVEPTIAPSPSPTYDPLAPDEELPPDIRDQIIQENQDIIRPDGMLETQLRAVTREELTICKGPGTQYKAIQTIPKNMAIVQLGYQNDDKQWVFIQYNYQMGWVNTEGLEFDPPSTDPDLVQPDYYADYNMTSTVLENLNLRKGPSTEHDIILTIPKGSRIKNIGFLHEDLSVEQERWQYVEYDGKRGWVNTSWLTHNN